MAGSAWRAANTASWMRRVLKNEPEATNRASAFSRTMLAKL
jgi:hypothetical protein